MINLILGCLFIYIFAMVLMGLFVFCVYVNDMFVASCKDIAQWIKSR